MIYSTIYLNEIIIDNPTETFIYNSTTTVKE